MGFRFASAIASDLKDMQRAQESVVQEYAAVGLLDEAAEHAALVNGWRRGTAYADLAVVFAGSGRPSEARTLIEKAETFRATVEGWQGPRIEAHVAEALVAIGEPEQGEKLMGSLAGQDGQYYGNLIAIDASAAAARGDAASAMKKLRAIDQESDIDIAWSRTQGYLALARAAAVAPTERRTALDAARRSAQGVPGWKQPDALLDVAAAEIDLGEKKRARETLEVAETAVLALPDTSLMRAGLAAELARSWALLGEKGRTKLVIDRALAAIPSVMVIDRPGGYASLAAAAVLSGDPAAGRRIFDMAFASAEALENARPRALAVVDICRALGRTRAPLDEATRTRLDALYSGLKDPW